nr:protein NYNRIN-like [Nicotiana tomentosiformis]
MADYEACIVGIRMAVDMNIKEFLRDGKPWYYDIKRFLEIREYPNNATNGQKRGLRRLGNHFFLNREVLYKRTPNLGLLRYVDAAEATKLLEEVHAGTSGPHMNGFTLAKNILRAIYFSMTMESDSICYVQKCYQCWIHGDYIWVPPNELNVMGSPWSFATWGMNVIGPIEPATSNGHRFILVAIDYFTKWVEASTYKVVTKKVVADLFRHNIVCQFGMLESIITDNAANLNSDLMREICEKFRIVHRNSTAYRLQMNGAVEAAKKIKRILRKIVDSHRQWHEKLSFTLLGYRTTMRTTTRATEYKFIYGTEFVILVEVEIPSLRVIQEE